MNIPYYHKRNSNDVNCAAVCLQMALAFFEKKKRELEEICKMAHSLGDCCYTLPWGMCIGAASASVELHATYISRKPKKLIPRYRVNIAKAAKISLEEVITQEKAQINECKEKEKYISLRSWKKSYSNLPGKLVAEEVGVVIPTVWQGDAHNIVLTGFDAMKVVYHDPNPDPNFKMGNKSLNTEEFLRIWLHDFKDEETDNDLLVISEIPFNPDDYV
jgi:hypothetical protein